MTQQTHRDRGYRVADLERATAVQSPDEPLRRTFLTLSQQVRSRSVAALNQLLVDTIMMRDLYKKHHWQLSGVTFYQLHLLFDAHSEQHSELVDLLAERVQLLGGVSIGMPRDVAERTRIEHPPLAREDPAVQLTRLLNAHEAILSIAHEMATVADADGDDRTADLIVSEVIRVNEKQAWFLAEHLVPTSLQGD